MVEKDTQAVEPAGGAGACAACGNISGNLKACTACRIVKYCNRDCQIKHRPAHKKACKHRLAELHDEKLFQQPPPNDECPICFLPQPIDPLGGVYKPCCGKLICGGCVLTVRTEVGDKKCPFCRTVTHYYFSEFKERMDKRIEANDPRAYANMASFYMDGRHAQCGLTRDISKAIQYYQKAAELGLDRGHYNLGLAYFTGNHGIKKDVKKATHHFEHAAIRGNTVARDLLGNIESQNGDNARALRHWMIAARAGSDSCMDIIKKMALECNPPLATKEQYVETLRAWKDASDEMKSEQREKAIALIKQSGNRQTLL